MGSARAITLAISLVTVPLVLGYLGAERYGMWLTISALLAVLGPLDLGMGNGLLQLLSAANGRDDREGARQAVSTAVYMLAGIAVVIVALALATASVTPWADVFNVHSPEAADEATPVALVLIILFAVAMPISVGGIIRSAYQSGYTTGAWAIVGSFASLVAIVIALANHASLPILAASIAGIGVASAAANGFVLFRQQSSWLAPRLSDFSPRVAATLVRTGAPFLILQLAGLAAYQLDNVVIAQIMGAAAVQQYAIPLKLFSLGPLIVSFALMPLWPAYGEALARGDGDWVRRAVRRSFAFALGINVPAALILAVAAPWLLDVWVGGAVTPSAELLIGLGIWTALNGLSGPVAMLLNGAGALRFQATCAVAMAFANLILSVVLVQRVGVAGAVYGSIIAQVVFILIPNAWYVPRLLRKIAAPSGTRTI